MKKYQQLAQQLTEQIALGVWLLAIGCRRCASR